MQNSILALCGQSALRHADGMPNGLYLRPAVELFGGLVTLLGWCVVALSRWCSLALYSIGKFDAIYVTMFCLPMVRYVML